MARGSIVKGAFVVGGIVVIGAALLAVSRMRATARAGPSRYNVLLITLDTTRADHLHCYGYGRETSPNLDALAADGVRFDCAINARSRAPTIKGTRKFPSTAGIDGIRKKKIMITP